MTDDIIVKLRRPLKCRTIDGVDVEYHPDGPFDDLLEEAAGEIERLRGVSDAAQILTFGKVIGQ